MPRGIIKTKPVVDGKSTKQEILDAYQQLIDSAQENITSENFEEKIKDVRKEFIVDTGTVVSGVTKTVSESVEQVERKLTDVLRYIDEVRKVGDNQKREQIKIKEETEKERTRETEEFDYTFRIRKERQELELADTKRKFETDLSQRQAILKGQEAELDDLRGQVKTFEARMQKAINDAVAIALKDQKTELEHQRAIENAESKSKVELLEQQVANYEKTTESLRTEITRLNGVLVETTAQLTRIAEKAVSRSDQYNPPISTVKTA